jgi:hypothetical protein
MERVKYTLKEPITHADETISELNFRTKVCTGDVRDLKAANMFETIGDVVKLAARLCGQPEAAINKLGLQDLNEIGDLVMGFMAAGRTGGKTPSP